MHACDGDYSVQQASQSTRSLYFCRRQSLQSTDGGSLPCLCSTLSTVKGSQGCRSAKACLEKEGAMSTFLSYSVFALTFTTLIMRRIRVISSNSLSIIVKLHVPFLRLVLLALIWEPTAQPPVPGSVMARAARLVLIGPPRTGFRRCRRRLRRDTPKLGNKSPQASSAQLSRTREPTFELVFS